MIVEFPRYVYRVEIDAARQDQWYLSNPHTSGVELDPRVFTRCVKVDPVPSDLVVKVGQAGSPIEFNLAAFDMPVVTKDVGELIERVAPADVQRIPALVEGTDGTYEILNVLNAVDCIDQERTRGTRWDWSDGRPEMSGKYRMIVDLRVRSQGLQHKIFRVAGWEIALLVTEDVKAALEAHKVSGITYTLVS